MDNRHDATLSSPSLPSPPQDPSDEELVQRAQIGDTAAYDVLVRRHFDRLFGFVYNMIGHRQDAEDLVQTIFVRAFRALRRFRGDSAFSTWLYRIALNTSYTAVARRRRRLGDVSLSELEDEGGWEPPAKVSGDLDTPHSRVSRKELQHRLNEALQTLSEEHRQVVVLHDIQGWRHEEIAKLTNLPVGTVRSRLFYARRHLQQQLAEFLP